MYSDKGEFTFFEGNFAGARTPRVIFLNWDNFIYAMRRYFWPFGSSNNITPYQNWIICDLKLKLKPNLMKLYIDGIGYMFLFIN